MVAALVGRDIVTWEAGISIVLCRTISAANPFDGFFFRQSEQTAKPTRTTIPPATAAITYVFRGPVFSDDELSLGAIVGRLVGDAVGRGVSCDVGRGVGCGVVGRGVGFGVVGRGVGCDVGSGVGAGDGAKVSTNTLLTAILLMSRRRRSLEVAIATMWSSSTEGTSVAITCSSTAPPP